MGRRKTARSQSHRTLLPRPTPTSEGAGKPSPELSAERYKRDKWQEMYPHIEKLYIRERRKLPDVIFHMEREHSFFASEQMYKKRLKTWGLRKYKTTPRQASMDDSADRGRVVASPRKATLVVLSPLGESDTVDLALMTNVRDWTTSYFQSASASSNCIQNFERAHYGIKLATRLLSRGHGVFAGRMARKAFLQLEDALYLDGPALVWNLTELIYNVAVKKHHRLLTILLKYLLEIARSRYPRTHPFVQMLWNLYRAATSSSPERVPLILAQAAILNAELILIDHFHPQYQYMYQTLLWDGCAIRFPDRVRRMVIPSGPKFEISTNPCDRINSTGSEIQMKEPMSNDDSIRELSQLDFDDPKFAQHVLPIRARSVFAPTRAEYPTGKAPESHAQFAASMNDVVADLLAKEGAYDESAKRLWISIRLREYSNGAFDPRVVWVMWNLEDLLICMGRDHEAAEVKKKCIERVEGYLEDVPKDSI